MAPERRPKSFTSRSCTSSRSRAGATSHWDAAKNRTHLATVAAPTKQLSLSSTGPGAVVPTEPAAETTAVLPGCAEEIAAALSESGERTPINLGMTDREIDDWCFWAALTNRSLNGSDLSAGTDVVMVDTPLAVVGQYAPKLVKAIDATGNAQCGRAD